MDPDNYLFSMDSNHFPDFPTGPQGSLRMKEEWTKKVKSGLDPFFFFSFSPFSLPFWYYATGFCLYLFLRLL